MLSTAELNLDALAAVARAAYVSLHTANPGNTGASEATGGSPAYARQAAGTWVATAGVATTPNPLTVDVPAGAYGFFGLWTAATGGTFIGWGTVALSGGGVPTPTGQAKVSFSPTVTATSTP